MFNIEYYGRYGSYLGVDKNVLQGDIPAMLAAFGRVAMDGDTIKICEIKDEGEE